MRANRIINGFLLITVILFMSACDSSIPHHEQLPTPAKIDEPLNTFYIGQVAVDFPQSWSLFQRKLKFFIGESDKSPWVEISEKKAVSENSDGWLEREIKLISMTKGLVADQSELLKEIDITEEFGRPAALLVFHIPPKSFNIMIVGQELKLPDTFNMVAILQEPWGNFQFEYEEEIDSWPPENLSTYLDERQKTLISWIKDFLPRYEWTGNDSPQGLDHLSTNYGRINLADPWPGLRYEFSAAITYLDKSKFLPGNYTDFYLRSYNSKESIRYSLRPNREVGGRLGHESKEIRGRKKDWAKWKFWEEKRFTRIDLEWRDSTTTQATPFSPAYDFRLDHYSRDDYDEAKAGYFFGVWDLVLDSVRPAEQVTE